MAKTYLVWDAPNIDMTLSQLLGRRPGPGGRPDMRALARWLVEQAEGDDVEGCVFVNVPIERPQALQGWIAFLTSLGYRVFAKPKHDGSDVDEDMVSFLNKAVADAGTFIIASNDARCFAEPLRTIAGAGVKLIVLGFEELAGELRDMDVVQFVDLEDVPGLLAAAGLQRVRLSGLEEAGGWFEPRSGLRQAVESATRADDDSTMRPN